MLGPEPSTVAPMICLVTPRLALRTWRADDLTPFAELCADPVVMAHVGDGRPRTWAESELSLTRIRDDWERRGFGPFALESLDDGGFIGFTGIDEPTFLPEILPCLEVGWRLRTDRWGQGLATEAATAVIDWSVAVIGVDRLVSVISVDNVRSIRVAGKLGMRAERRTVVPSTGRWVDVYELSAADWQRWSSS